MLRQLLTNDIPTVKRHIQSHARGNGPMVVARIAGWVGIPQVYDVREELHPLGPTRQRQEHRMLQELPPLPSPAKRLEVQIHPHGGVPWHIAQALYLKEASETEEGKIMCCKAPLQNLDRSPLMSEMYEWTLTEKAQRLVAYGRARREKKRGDALSVSKRKERQD